VSVSSIAGAAAAVADDEDDDADEEVEGFPAAVAGAIIVGCCRRLRSGESLVTQMRVSGHRRVVRLDIDDGDDDELETEVAVATGIWEPPMATAVSDMSTLPSTALASADGQPPFG
jgi:hypothetical protein